VQPPPGPPDNGEGMDPTIAMPRVQAPPQQQQAPQPEPPRQTPYVEYGVVQPPPGPVPVSPLTRELPPHPVQRAPVVPPYAAAPVIPPPAATVVAPRPRYVFGNPVGYTFARFVAFVVDVGLVTTVATLLIYGFGAINPVTNLPTDSQGGLNASLAIGAAISLAYMWIAEAFFGTTIGKLAVGLHVYSARGGFIGLGRSFVRNILRPMDALVIGWILAILPGHRRLGDLLGGTVVARSPLRAFAPLVGWILIIILAAVPVLMNGWEHTLAALVAFGQFVPALVGHAWAWVTSLFGGVPPR
jgi:uncharacterized RDD family membrane protein YckC